jgi:pimeloyl-ACP methyl ester carboxylesterase
MSELNLHERSLALAPMDLAQLDTLAPNWFTEACAQPLRSNWVAANGCQIHYLAWKSAAPNADAAGIMFVHGGGAHANWWRFVAPFFTSLGPVVAIDLSGMGDSAWRDSYSATIRADEIEAVMHDAGFYGPNRRAPYLVGHSFGGLTAMRHTALYGDAIGGFVIAEAPVRPPHVSRPKSMQPINATTLREYANYAEAIARFRLKPKQTCEHDFIIEHIAHHSIRATATGFTWKFDPSALTSERHSEPFRDYLSAARCRTALLFAEQSSLCTPEVVDYMATLQPASTPRVFLPHAQHHLMLDQPLAFVSAVRAILSNWSLA